MDWRTRHTGAAIFAAIFTGAALWACSADAPPPDRTDRERDSLIGQSILPGARGVRGAIGVSDSASARNARLDSIADNP